jgi:hypothetical protein
LSLNLGPFEIYFLTDNILAFGVLNPNENFLSNNASSSLNIDTKKVRNGQFHFGINLTFGRDKKEKPGSETDENRAKAVSTTPAEDGGNSNKSGTSTIKTVLPTGKSTSSKSTKSDYSKKSEKKKNKRKGELKPKVQQSAPKGSTYRKVSNKL